MRKKKVNNSKVLTIASICKVFGYSRQSYYKWLKENKYESFFINKIVSEIKEIRKRQPNVGCRKLQVMLANKGCFIGRDKLFDILRENKMLIKNKRNYRRTTNSEHLFKKYNNLIKDIKVTSKEKIFISDITYIRTKDGFKYLSLVSDKATRKIMGYFLSDNLTIEGSMKALKMALRGVKNPAALIHHSDRGVQYCSYDYTNYLNNKKVKISMTEKDHVYENAQAERVNGILKNELLLNTSVFSYSEAKKAVSEAISIYNNERLHCSLGYITPEMAHNSKR